MEDAKRQLRLLIKETVKQQLNELYGYKGIDSTLKNLSKFRGDKLNDIGSLLDKLAPLVKDAGLKQQIADAKEAIVAASPSGVKGGALPSTATEMMQELLEGMPENEMLNFFVSFLSEARKSAGEDAVLNMVKQGLGNTDMLEAFAAFLGRDAKLKMSDEDIEKSLGGLPRESRRR